MKKNYVGISRDHSGSMGSLKEQAIADYNQNISAIKEAALEAGQDTVVSVVSCGIRSGVQREVVNSSVNALEPLRNYPTDGQTPLFDSVGELIDILLTSPDAQDLDVSFLVMVITDGEENHSKKWTGSSLNKKIAQLQATDRWTFTFRVPHGSKGTLMRLGIPEGNIFEWEASARGFVRATKVASQAIRGYYTGLSQGQRASTRFYTDLASVSTAAVEAALENITNEVTIYPVRDTTLRIREFVESKLTHNAEYKIGAGFYQLTKPETVQGHKQVVIRDRSTGACYGGAAARQVLGLPPVGDMKVHPGNHGKYDVFVQSTSVNRKLVPGSMVLYWPHAISTPAARY